MHHFLSAGPNRGVKVDFRRRRLVGIGHSLGGNAMYVPHQYPSHQCSWSFRLLLQHLEPIVTFSSIIIVEPLLSPAGPHHLDKLRSILVKGAYERRDVWTDRTMAMKSIKSRERTKKWDPRITDLFVVCVISVKANSYLMSRSNTP